MQNQRYVALDGLRGIAAIAVVFRHAHVAALPFAHGYLAVDLFFLLSGFVIARSYEARLAEGRIGLGAYMALRGERLYPLLLVGGLVGVALWALGLGEARLGGAGMVARAVASQLLLVPFLAMPHFFAFNGAHWSIVFELLVNFVHAVALPWLSDRVLAGIVLVSALGLAMGTHRFGTLDIGWTWGSVGFGVPRVGFGFFLGVLLFRTRERWTGRVPVLGLPLLGAVLLAVANAPESVITHGLRWQAFDLVAVFVLFPPLVMAGSVAGGGKWAEALGLLSFPLYAIHKPMIEALLLAKPSAGAGCAEVLGLVVLAWVLGKLVDEPLNEWRRKGRRQGRHVARGVSTSLDTNGVRGAG